MSRRSFFRYFPSKEDVLFGQLEAMGEQVAAEVAARPPQEGPWECLHAVLRGWEARINTQAEAMRPVERTPALRARLLQKRDEARVRIVEALRRPPPGPRSTRWPASGCAPTGATAATPTGWS
ncbi:hypothetical protein ABZ907_06035 [Nonomuraea wenchangensis]